ncbi:Sensor histidine kinase YehU [compost metagenome]
MKKSVSKQLFFAFLVVIVLSLSSVGMFSYWQSAKALERQSEQNIAQIISSASYQTDLYLRTYERASDSILSNNMVKKFLDIDPNDSYEYFHYTFEITKNVFRPTFILYPQINQMYVIGSSGKAIIDDNLNQLSTNKFDSKRQYQYLLEHTPDNGSIAILQTNINGDTNSDTITMARRVRGVASYEPNGVLAIEFKAKDLSNIWEPLGVSKNGFFLILDEAGRYVYRPTDSQLAVSISNRLKNELQNDSNSYVIQKINEKSYFLVSRKSNYTGWSLVMGLPLDELREPAAQIRTMTLIMGFIFLLASLVLAMRFGKSITDPIRTLREAMRVTEKGNWMQLPPTKREDEIGGLMHSYNLMVTRLQEMIERVYEAELSSQKTAIELHETQLERHRAEFQALQLQINPHFLYNTLETIKCYAVVEDSDEIAEMVEAMAFMMRYSIQTNLEEITIANELRHVLSFLTILKHRNQKEFEITVSIPPAYLLQKTVRLTLQPLVENAFQHAFPDGIEEHHRISIDAKLEKDRFLVIVEDNGQGITTERLETLRERLRENRLAESETDSIYHLGGIGLMNVHRRIQMVYGEAYGLTIESELGQGTRITMSMPT